MKHEKFTVKLMAGICFSVIVFASCKKNNNTTPDPQPVIQNDIAAVNSAISGFMSSYNIPGASLAVSKNGKLVYIKGFGLADQSTGEKVTPAHRFRLASVSKTFTGVAIMKLVQEGKLTLDGKVFGPGSVFGTDYGTAPYNANVLNITVRHLLQNLSGSWGSVTGGDVVDQNQSYTYKQFMDWVIDGRPHPNAPGTLYDYSNVNFVIAGRIIEKISGKPYINYIKEDIMATVGGTQTEKAGVTLADIKTNEVKYYGQGNDANFVYNILFSRRDADGGLMTTATDLLKLVNAIDGATTRPDILNSNALTLLTTPSTIFPSYACGIGIWTAENVWFNYGSLPGTRTGFMRNSNGVCVALLLNSRVDPTTGETQFVQAMQNIMLTITKNTSYPWQDIDQF
jgi:D-alanyl-D-alanine carboxypeptidase